MLTSRTMRFMMTLLRIDELGRPAYPWPAPTPSSPLSLPQTRRARFTFPLHSPSQSLAEGNQRRPLGQLEWHLSPMMPSQPRAGVAIHDRAVAAVLLVEGNALDYRRSSFARVAWGRFRSFTGARPDEAVELQQVEGAKDHVVTAPRVGSRFGGPVQFLTSGQNPAP